MHPRIPETILFRRDTCHPPDSAAFGFMDVSRGSSRRPETVRNCASRFPVAPPWSVGRLALIQVITRVSLMKKLYVRFTLMCLALLISACTGPNTPEDVTYAFWEAVVGNDADDAVKYSTLPDVGEYDGFGRDWNGFTPELGRIVIEGDEASVETRLVPGENGGERPVEFVTHLVRREETWKIDYARTASAVRGGPLAQLFGQLERLGKDLSDQFKATSDTFSAEMERLGRQLDALSDSLNAQAAESIEKYGEELRRSIEELAESARRALEEHERELSGEDRRALQEVSAELAEDSDTLASRPTLQSIADSSETVATARQQLDAIDSKAVEAYREQWHEWGDKFEADMQEMLAELAAITEHQDGGE